MVNYIVAFLSQQLPEGSYLLAVIVAIVLFIIWYLYRTSELFDKKKLKFFTTLTLIISVLSFSFLWFRDRPIQDKPRLAIFPLDTSTLPEKEHWIGWAVVEIIGKRLQQDIGDKISIYPIEWTYPIANRDSLQYSSYLSQVSSKIKASFYFSGQVKSQPPGWNLIYKFYPLKSSDSLCSEVKVETLEKITEVGTEIAWILAKRLGHQAIEMNPHFQPSVAVLKNYVEGKKSFVDKHYQKSLEFGEKVVKDDSSFVPGLILLAESYLKEGQLKKSKGLSPEEDYRNARQILDNSVELDSANYQIHRLLGQYFILQEKWNKAEQELRRVLQINPQDPFVYALLAQLHGNRYQDLGFDNEEELFRRALFLNPCFFEARISLANYLYYQNRPEHAIKELKKLLEINPNSLDGLMALERMYVARNQIINAIDIFGKIIKMDPLNSDAYYNLGIVYYHSEDLDTALRFFQQAIKIDNHLDAHLYLAYIYEEKGDMDKAIEYLRKRIRYKKGPDDQFAEEARKHLYKLLHPETGEP